MRPEIIARLLSLNQEFYQSFASSFAETRTRLQPGVLRTLNAVARNASVLDLGCGNGALAHGLHERDHEGLYIGLDSSAPLLTIARQRCKHPRAQFHQVDLTTPEWSNVLPAPFDHVFAFAVFHHIPGHALRERVAREVYSIASPEGVFTLSNWNFMESPRLRERVLPWGTIELSAEDVEERDYLLDWRRDGYGLRYVHLFDEAELHLLADSTGFRVLETFYSDGEGGRLGLYQTWRKA